MIFKVVFGSEIHIVKSTNKERFTQFLNFLPSVFKSLPKKFKLSYLDEEGDQITFEDQNDYDVLLGTAQKSVKIIIRENNEDFVEMTNQIHIDEAHQEIMEQEISEIKHVQHKPEANASMQEIDDSVIEEKLKMMLPQIISKIKTQITEEIMEKSKMSAKNQPVIVQDPVFKKQVWNDDAPKVEKKVEKLVHRGITCDGCQFRNIQGIRYKCAVCPDFDFCEKCEATVEHPHPFLKIKTLKQTPIKIFAVINEDNGPSFGGYRQHCRGPHSFDHMVNQGIGMVKGFFGGEYNEEFKKKYQNAKEEWTKRSQEWKKAWSCPQKEEQKVEKKVQEKMEEKVEEKVEKKVEEKVEVKKEVKKEQKKDNILPKNSELFVVNANYLVEVFGYSFEKCWKWAQMYPYMSKEELLSYCLSQPSFHN